MQPVQLQLITQHQTPMTSSAPPPVHLPPSKQQQQHINYQQTSIVSPPSSSTSPSASSNGSNHNGNVVNASPPMGGARDEENKIRDKCLYLKQLLQDKKQIQGLAGCFLHADRILDEEIVKVRSVLFQNGDKQPLELPSAQGATITLTEKVYVPVKDHPEYNFVGRLLGPRGLTAKQLEQETSCKIMVRGKGSMRDKKKEDSNRGKPNWEHLSDELHVLITVEDTENRARIKMDRALEEIQKLLVPTEGEDDLKKKQLMELAIINGTYRDYSMTAANQPRLIAAPPVLQGPQLRSPPAQGQPPINLLNNHILSRLPNGQHVITNGMTTQPPPMHITPSDGSLLYYTPTFEYPGTLTAPTFEYGLIDPSAILGQTAGGNKMFRPAPANQTQARVHPYQRPTATN